MTGGNLHQGAASRGNLVVQSAVNDRLKSPGRLLEPSGRRSIRAVVLVLLSLAVCAAGTAATAQYGPSEQETLFVQTLRDPANHELTFAFVKVATANGDYEAAIGALERLLFYQPNLTRVKLELSILYSRLGSYEMARGYLRDAANDPSVDEPTRARVAASISAVDKQSQPSRFSGFFQTGMRYQSNASFMPDSGLVRFAGQDFSLFPTTSRKPDWNWFGIAGLAHDYDFQNDRGDRLETRFIGYLTNQHRFSELDVGLFEVSFGPRLALAPSVLPGVTVKPYIVGGRAWVGGSEYLTSAGAGVSVGMPIGTTSAIEPTVEYRRADADLFRNGLFSSVGSGDVVSVGFSSGTRLTEGIRLEGRSFYRRGDATLNYQSFYQLVSEFALTMEVTPPFPAIAQKWTVSPFLRLVNTRFEAPNPFIDAFRRRRDDEWRVGTLFDLPLTQHLGVSTTIQYAKTHSNLPNYRTDNLSIVVGPTARF